MNFIELKQFISTESQRDTSFEEATSEITNVILQCNKPDLIDIVSEIGVIPETIGHDSSEEKLFAK